MKKWFGNILSSIGHETVTTTLPVETLFDGVFLPEHKLVIHFISIDKTPHLPENYFKQINENAAKLRLKWIHVWEDVYTRHPELVIARILALTGQRRRVHARTTEVKRITKPEAEVFLNTHHLQQWANAYYKFGLYHHTELVAVATFSKSRVMLDGIVPYRSYEMVRFASKTGVTVTGGLSKLLNLFIQELNPAHIMTYTDNDWGIGEGFEKLGFVLVETTAPIPFYIDPDTYERFSEKQAEAGTHPKRIKVYNSGSNKFVLDRRNYTS